MDIIFVHIVLPNNAYYYGELTPKPNTILHNSYYNNKKLNLGCSILQNIPLPHNANPVPLAFYLAEDIQDNKLYAFIGDGNFNFITLHAYPLTYLTGKELYFHTMFLPIFNHQNKVIDENHKLTIETNNSKTMVTELTDQNNKSLQVIENLEVKFLTGTAVLLNSKKQEIRYLNQELSTIKDKLADSNHKNDALQAEINRLNALNIQRELLGTENTTSTTTLPKNQKNRKTNKSASSSANIVFTNAMINTSDGETGIIGSRRNALQRQEKESKTTNLSPSTARNKKRKEDTKSSNTIPTDSEDEEDGTYSTRNNYTSKSKNHMMTDGGRASSSSYHARNNDMVDDSEHDNNEENDEYDNENYDIHEPDADSIDIDDDDDVATEIDDDENDVDNKNNSNHYEYPVDLTTNYDEENWNNIGSMNKNNHIGRSITTSHMNSIRSMSSELQSNPKVNTGTLIPTDDEDEDEQEHTISRRGVHRTSTSNTTNNNNTNTLRHGVTPANIAVSRISKHHNIDDMKGID